MNPHDEKFVKQLRRTQPVLLAFSFLSFVLSFFVPAVVEWWAEVRDAESVFVVSPEAYQRFENIKTETKLERQLKRVVLSDLDTQRTVFYYFKVLISMIIAAPFFVFGIAGLSHYHTNRRFLKIIEIGVSP